ncbi:MAG: hypothetical protein LBF15_01995 [Candidatus Peribacteria bacterium]|jgi:hypothetical protein|nr:hypothetical protein [Candidatus Peribacteria bacterium]
MESLAGRQMSEEELARKYIGLLYMSLNELLRKISIGRKHEFCGIQALYKIKEVLTK